MSTEREVDKELLDFYTQVLARPSLECEGGEDFLKEVTDRATELDGLTVQVTLGEIAEAVKAAKSNKAPGTDGIPVEFYQSFWEQIGPLFREMLADVLENERVTKSQG